ncbi:disintegrin and metalloproteinase domain-containing protein 21-like [Trichechus manatus latirostris]|uniref:Disintegrin and metalloproteinase domain-containing protein 21-like n=1 Tax=Trichechus manatus latirostris TaxID=127582 RepID=A0A2Y9E847_TRIMA|nr:disintegrin and metalloproteinase domain-containing protein 21-like [Trichechus manatus latirostris]
MRINLRLLWPGVFLVLSGLSQVGHSQYHSPPEVVIPLRLTGTDRSMKAPGWISYNLNFGGQRHIVHIKAKKLLVSRQLSVFTYTDQGALLEDHPFVQTNCYYDGYVEGDSGSLVSFSSCFGGFQGLLQTKDITYEIKPKRFSHALEHLVYKVDSEEAQSQPLQCGLTEEEIARQLKLQESENSTLTQSTNHVWWTRKWFIELAVVADYNLFLHCNRNISKVQETVFDIIHKVDSIYSPLNVEITLLALEIWNVENPFPLNSSSKMLDDFCNWKKISFNSRVHHDVANLFTRKRLGFAVGYSFVDGTCRLSYNCEVSSFTSDDLNFFAFVVAHEIGHSLGLATDTTWCTCGRKRCIMSATGISTTKFSNCSYADLGRVITKKTCLLNVPNPGDNFIWKRCGNGVVEEGEQCDCGSSDNCTKDPCCQSNCTLSPGADCAFGLCCKDCKFMPAGKVCRQQANECDLPEWCNGTTHQCPEDVYVQDGIPCTGGGYCYEKRCNNRDEQCRQIFGKEAKSARKICYEEMNTRGDRFGHCGTSVSTYVKCNISDILCGRVQCEHVRVIPLLREHSTVQVMHLDGVTCWGTDYHFGMTIPDIGEVKDGTECGPNRICIRRKCVSMSSLKSYCSPNTCRERGVCNNKGHCHCSYDWAPPHCLIKGRGGSLDSGPPTDRSEQKKENIASFLSLFVLLHVFVLWFCLLIVLYKKYKHKKKKNQLQSESKKEEPPFSISENKDEPAFTSPENKPNS